MVPKSPGIPNRRMGLTSHAGALSGAFHRFELPTAAALAAVARADSDSPEEVAHWEGVEEIAKGYHFYFLTMPVQLRPPLFALQLTERKLGGAAMFAEAGRLVDLFEATLSTVAGEAVVEFLFAYVAAAQMDGLRLLIWLNRTISSLDAVCTVSMSTRRLGARIADEVRAATGNAAPRKNGVEPYAALQKVADELSGCQGVGDPFERLDEFKVRLPGGKPCPP